MAKTRPGAFAQGFNQAQQRGFAMLNNMIMMNMQRERELQDFSEQEKIRAGTFRHNLATQYELSDTHADKVFPKQLARKAEEQQQGLGFRGQEKEQDFEYWRRQQEYQREHPLPDKGSADDARHWAEMQRKREEFYIEQQYEKPMRDLSYQINKLENPTGLGKTVSNENKQKIKQLRYQYQEILKQKDRYLSQSLGVPIVERPGEITPIRVPRGHYTKEMWDRVSQRLPDHRVLIEGKDAGNHYNARVNQHRADGTNQALGERPGSTQKKVVKTGVYNGRKVVQYDDGSVEYAD
jgi:hypothetical protein